VANINTLADPNALSSSTELVTRTELLGAIELSSPAGGSEPALRCPSAPGVDMLLPSSARVLTAAAGTPLARCGDSPDTRCRLRPRGQPVHLLDQVAVHGVTGDPHGRDDGSGRG